MVRFFLFSFFFFPPIPFCNLSDVNHKKMRNPKTKKEMFSLFFLCAHFSKKNPILNCLFCFFLRAGAKESFLFLTRFVFCGRFFVQFSHVFRFFFWVLFDFFIFCFCFNPMKFALTLTNKGKKRKDPFWILFFFGGGAKKREKLETRFKKKKKIALRGKRETEKF